MPSQNVLGAARGAHAIDRTLGQVIANIDGDTKPDHYDETPAERVYVLLDAEACQVKIGVTGDVDRRQTQLERERGRKLDRLHVFKGGRSLEKALHGRFAPYRVEKNEWYSTEILGELATIV